MVIACKCTPFLLILLLYYRHDIHTYFLGKSLVYLQLEDRTSSCCFSSSWGCQKKLWIRVWYATKCQNHMARGDMTRPVTLLFCHKNRVDCRRLEGGNFIHDVYLQKILLKILLNIRYRSRSTVVLSIWKPVK
jgi:hypothetical protein